MEHIIGPAAARWAKSKSIATPAEFVAQCDDPKLLLEVLAKMVAAGTIDAAALKQARALAPTLSPSQGGRTQWGGRLPPGLAPKLRPDHHSDPLAGIVRREAAYSAAAAAGSQSTYRKWRRITQWGKPWIHPGIRAAHIASKVMAQMGQIVRDAFEAGL